MGHSRVVVRQRTRLVGATLLGLLFSMRPAAYANNAIQFSGGPMRNLVIDVVFWGSGITDTDRADVRDYLRNFSGYMNGFAAPAGKEAAVHYYGLSGVIPGAWINDSNPLPNEVLRGGCCSLTETQFTQQVAAAHSGSFGPSFDFDGTLASNTLPAGPTRLAVVITKGTNKFAQTIGRVFSNPVIAPGFHNNSGTPWAAAMFDPNGAGTISFPVVLSHEIIEAMTDVAPWNGWITNTSFLGLAHAEACDQCGGDSLSPQWIASTADNISGITDMIMDRSFGGINNIAQNSCQAYEPEEYAPLALTFEPNRSGVFLDMFYRTPAGTVSQLTWTTPSASASGPLDWGQPQVGSGSLRIPSIIALGKPSAVPGFGPGATLVFLRGSDNAVWMLSAPDGQWVSLGGQIFGDPSAVNRGGIVHVFGLGTDDHIYTNVITNSVPSGWAQIGNSNIGFVGSPRAFSRSSTTIDLFATDEHGLLEWLSFSTSTGWSSPSGTPSTPNFYHFAPVGVSSWGTNQLDIIINNGSRVSHRGWSGSWGTSEAITPLQSGPLGTPAVASWGTGRLDAFVTDTQNKLFHAYKTSTTGQWNADVNSPMRSDAVGDPVVVSRGSSELDVFYRTTAGSLTHLNFNAGFWTFETNILPGGSIQ